MAVVYPHQARLMDLERLMNGDPTVWIMLFKADPGNPPPIDVVFGDLVEADFSGYSAISVSPGSAPVINGDDNAETIFDLAQFEHDGGGTDNDVYGWAAYMVWDSVNQLLAIERWATGPRTMEPGADPIRVTLVKTQGGCP